MRRLFLLIAVAIVLGVGAAWLADTPGRVIIDWRGWRIEAAAVTLGVIALAFAFLLWALYRFYGWLRYGTPLAPARRKDRRHQKGLQALTTGFNALAGGDARAALKRGREADRLLEGAPVALLLTAQAAEASGDEDTAKGALERLADREDSATLGLRGLIRRALKNDDLRTARRLLEETPDSKRPAPWQEQLRFDLAIRDGAWEEAEDVFRRLVKGRMLDDRRKQRIEAAILYARAREADLAGNTADALDLARRALKKDASLSPAAALAARLLKADGRGPDGDGVLVRAWAAAPAPILLEAALAGHEHDSATERARRIATLVRKAPDHKESRLARAALALEAGDWAEARVELEALRKDAPNSGPGKRVLRMLARLERSETGNEEAAQDWLLEAEAAPADDRWRCTACGTGRDRWSLTCPECGGLATLDWGLEERATPDNHTRTGRSLLADLGAGPVEDHQRISP